MSPLLSAKAPQNPDALKPSELLSTLKVAYKKCWPTLIVGTPGGGKTELFKKAARESIWEGDDKPYDLEISHPVISDPTDYKGCPALLKEVVGNKETTIAEFLPFGALRRMIEAIRPLLVGFDDIGQAPQSVQAALMQLLLERSIDGKKISEHVRFVAATNGKKDGAGVSGLITPLISRFRTIVDLQIDPVEWRTWAINAGMPVELIGYISLFPEDISTFNPANSKDIKNFSCPRTLEFLGDWVNAGVMDVRIWKGTVGEDVATKFKGFYEIFKSVGMIIDNIIKSGDKVDLPQDDAKFGHISYAISSALSYKASVVNIDNIAKYIEKLGKKEADYRVFFWKTATEKTPDLKHSKQYITWCATHSEDLD